MRTKDDIKTQKRNDEENYEHRSWRKIDREREQNIRISM